MAQIKWISKEEENQKIKETERIRLEKENLEKEISKMPEKIVTLETENMSLMLAAAETYEQMYNENMTLMLAVAEMYEQMQKSKGGTV